METRAHHLLIGSFLLLFLVGILGFALWLAKTQIDREIARYNILFTGSAMTAIDFGGGWLTGDGSFDVFVAKFSPTGAHVWSKRARGTQATGESANAVAANQADDVLVTGAFASGINFGAGPLSMGQSGGGFLVELAP